MKIKSVEINNILSIKQMSLEFNDSGLVLLDGYNYDDDTANGAGKTAIFNSICFGLFGKLPRKISASEILREGSKSGYVKVCVDNGISVFEVTRSRPNSLKFTVDTLEKNMTQEEFEGHIKMSYHQFLISMYSAQTEGSKLISLNDSAKKDFFLKLMNLDSFDVCRSEIDKTIKTLEADKSRLEYSKLELSTKINTYREALEDEDELEQDIKNINLSGLKKQLSKYQAVIKPDVEKFDSLEERLSDEYRELQSLENTNKSSLREIAQIDSAIHRIHSMMPSIDCPHCLQAFIPNKASIDADLQKLAIAKTSALSNICEDDIEQKKVKIKELIIKCRLKKAEQLKDFEEAQLKIASINSELMSKQSQLAMLNKAIENNRLLAAKISENKNKLESISLKIESIEEQITLNQTLNSVFAPTGATAYVLDSAIDVFNERVAYYVSLIWGNASYTLLSYKENKTGDIRAKLSENLVIGGKERSIGALSGGEHRCLSLAIDFAVIDVLETMFGIVLNPIMLDEPFNDLDAANRERVIDLLDKIAANRQIWVIDHASEVRTAFSTVVRVEKRSGISALA
jgi:DNA repair exonuclease SbcCD ATPase subunit